MTVTQKHATFLESRNVRAGFINKAAARGKPQSVIALIKSKHTGREITRATGETAELALDNVVAQLKGLPSEDSHESLLKKLAETERERDELRAQVEGRAPAKTEADDGGEGGEDDPDDHDEVPEDERALKAAWADTDDETLKSIFLEKTGGNPGNRKRDTMIRQLAEMDITEPPAD